MAFTVLQTISEDHGIISGGEADLAFAGDVAAGSLILVALRIGDPTTDITAITDTRGTTYTQVDVQLQSTDTHRLHLWQGLVVPGAGPNTVAATFSADGASLRWAIHEFGSDGTQVRDQKSKGEQDATTAPSAGSITPGVDNELIFGCIGAGGNPAMAATGSFTLRETPANKLGTETWIQTTATATDIGFTTDGDNFSAQIVSYKQVAAGGGTFPPVPAPPLNLLLRL